jgi:hypothetical protein
MSRDAKIKAANIEAVRRMNAAEPVLVDIAPAKEVIPGFTGKMLLHSGPPITWEKMCGAQRGALVGLVLFEKWAQTPDEANRLLASGQIELAPNHHFHAVGSMAGATSPSLPVWVVENQAFGTGNRAYCGHADSRQTFGEYGDDVLAYLNEWRDIYAPALRKGIKSVGSVPLKSIIGRSLQMGDGLHSRCLAASSLLANELIRTMVNANVEKDHLLRTIDHITNHRLIFLSLAMASAKAMTDSASNIDYSTVVVAMARNGVEFGIRVSGLGDQWFTAPAPKAFMKSFVPLGKGVQPWEKNFGLVSIPSEESKKIPRWTEEFAGLDMGDSAITETVGWGANLLANQLGFLPIVGCSLDTALALTNEVRQLSVSASTNYAIPILNFEGSPLGIDIRKIVNTGVLPVIDTGIAHKEPGHPIVGSGLARPPLECFKKALQQFDKKYSS